MLPAADRGSMELKRRDLEVALERLTARAEALAAGGPDPDPAARSAGRPA